MEEETIKNENERNSLWIKPRETTMKAKLYNVLEKNEFFELIEHISTKLSISSFLFNNMKKISKTIQPYNYKIILLDENNNCIAVAEK